MELRDLFVLGFIAIVAGVFGVSGNYFMSSGEGQLGSAYLIGAGGLLLVFWMAIIFLTGRSRESPLVEYLGAIGAAGIYATGGVVNWSQVPVQYRPSGFSDIWLIAAVGMTMVGLLKTQPIKGHVEELFDDHLGDGGEEVRA